jgi:hypothetical protein
VSIVVSRQRNVISHHAAHVVHDLSKCVQAFVGDLNSGKRVTRIRIRTVST